MLAPLLIAFQSLVAGETCPAPVDVEARVRTILHLPVEQELSEGFVVERHESGLYVELRSADNAVIGQRTLPVEGTCDELAQAAAVVLSAWLSDVHPDFAGALPPAVEPAVEPAPPPVPVPEPTPAPVLRSRTAPPPPAAPPPPPRRLQLGLGVGADLAGESLALAGVLVAAYLPARQGLGLSGFAAVTWPREEPLGPGTVAWRRWPAGVGPSLRGAMSSLSWDVSAGPAIGWMHFSGTKFERSSQKNGFAGGGFLDLRIASRGRHLGVFALLNAQLFPEKYGASASGADGPWAITLPRFSLGLAAGGWLSP